MTETINQVIAKDTDSICKSCSHERVCRATENQPCAMCDHYEKKQTTGHWINRGGELHCSICSGESGYSPNGGPVASAHCPTCGVLMEA